MSKFHDYVEPTVENQSTTNKPTREAGKVKGNKSKAKTGDRFATINTIVDLHQRELKPTEFSVLITLWRDTKPNGLAQASLNDLANRSGKSRCQVKRAIKSLINKKLIRLIKKGSNLTHQSNIYQLIT